MAATIAELGPVMVVQLTVTAVAVVWMVDAAAPPQTPANVTIALSNVRPETAIPPPSWCNPANTKEFVQAGVIEVDTAPDALAVTFWIVAKLGSFAPATTFT